MKIFLVVILYAAFLSAEVKKDSTLSYIWNESDWDLTSKIVYSYPSADMDVSQSYFWVGVAWISATTITTTYNEYGYAIKMVMDNMGFSTVTDFIYTYDNDGNISELVLELNEVKSTKEVYTWENGKNIGVLISDWNGAGWDESMRITNEYSGANLSVSLYEEFDGNTWNPTLKTLFSYENGKLSYWLSQTPGISGGWVDLQKLTNTYNQSGQVSELLIELKDGETWVNSTKDIYFYGETSAIEDILVAPETYSLSNYPNPFNPKTTIRFYLPESQILSIKIFSVNGQLIKTLTEGSRWTPGYHETEWNGTDSGGNFVASGLYIYMLEGQKNIITKKCLLIK